MTASKLTTEQFNTLKEIYVERIVDNMSMKDLVYYVTEDMQKWVDSLTYNDAMVEFQTLMKTIRATFIDHHDKDPKAAMIKAKDVLNI